MCGRRQYSLWWLSRTLSRTEVDESLLLGAAQDGAACWKRWWIGQMAFDVAYVGIVPVIICAA